MRIGIDSFHLVPRQGVGGAGGTYTYVHNLVRSLAHIDQKDEFYIFGNRALLNDLELQGCPNFHLIESPLVAGRKTWKPVWLHCLLPVYVRRYHIEVMHYPINIMPVVKVAKSVVTIHDLMAFFYAEHFPQILPKFRTEYEKILIPLTARRADRVIADSEFTKREVIRLCKIDPHKIEVVYLGADRRFGFGEASKLPEGLDLPDVYILNVATLSIHKNTVSLFKALRILKDKGSLKAKLVCVGTRGTGWEHIVKAVQQLRLTNDVVFTGFVDSSSLALVYRRAKAFVLPSLNEGFGVPVIEAMHAGVPVICSSAASLPEVAGDAAILVDPNDVVGLAEAIRRVLEDQKLRETLILKGTSRARLFTWDVAAQRTLEIYRKAAVSEDGSA